MATKLKSKIEDVLNFLRTLIRENSGKIVFFSIFIFVGTVFISYSQSQEDSLDLLDSTNQVQQIDASKTFSEAEYYKKLYELETLKAKQVNDDLRMFIGWTLSIFCSFGLFIIGGQAFVNFKSNEERIKGIENKFEIRFNEVDTSSKDIEKKIDNKSTELNKSFDEKIENAETTLKGKIKNLREEFERNIKVKSKETEVIFNGIIEDKIKSVEKQFEEKTKNTKEDLQLLIYTYYYDISYSSTTKNSPDLGVIYAFNALKAISELDYDNQKPEYNMGLSRMSSNLNLLFEAINEKSPPVLSNTERYNTIKQIMPNILSDLKNRNLGESIDKAISSIEEKINRLSYKGYSHTQPTIILTCDGENNQPIV